MRWNDRFCTDIKTIFTFCEVLFEVESCSKMKSPTSGHERSKMSFSTENSAWRLTPAQELEVWKMEFRQRNPDGYGTLCP